MCSIAGSVKASGAQNRAPTKLRNLSILSASITAQSTPKVITKVLCKFFSHFLSPLFFFNLRHLNTHFSKILLAGLIAIGQVQMRLMQTPIFVIITIFESEGNNCKTNVSVRLLPHAAQQRTENPINTAARVIIAGRELVLRERKKSFFIKKKL